MNTTSTRRTAGMLLASTAAALAWPGTPAADARAAKVPDIRITSVVPTKTQTEAGWGLTVRATVRNAGGGTTQAGAVRFSLSKDTSPGKDVRLPPDVPVPALQAGQQTVLPPTLDVPAKTPPGRYYVLACARVPGKDGAKANDCVASKKKVTVQAPIRGHLTGQVIFDRATAEVGSDWSDTSSDHASVEVDVRVDGRQEGWDVFTSTGSSWLYQGSAEKVSHPDGCEVTITGTSSGSGTLRQTGDQYEDDLLGAFRVEDHSRIDLLIGLRYDHTVRTKQVPTEELGCRPEDSTAGPTELRSLSDLDLRQVRKTEKTIVYKVAGATDPYSKDTEWDTVSCTLTLELD